MLISEKKWRELLKCGKEKYSERVNKDSVELEFWKKFIKDKRTIEDKYAQEIKKVVLSSLNEMKSALEIGPGWGNYTFDIAKKVEKLFCLDFSTDILNFILNKAKIKNINNINIINSKLEDANLNKYDFIFAYNCFYRIKEIEKALKKLIESTNKMLIIGMNSNLDREPTLEIHNNLNIEIKKHFLHHNAINDVLMEMGIKTEIKELILERTYDFKTLEAAFNFEKGFILEKIDEFKEKQIKEILSKYYKYTNKKYSYKHKIKAGLIFINMNKI